MAENGIMEFVEYWVTASVRDAYAQAIEAAAHLEYDARVAGVIVGEPSNGFALVAFQVRV